jgi:hypothetical protein
MESAPEGDREGRQRASQTHHVSWKIRKYVYGLKHLKRPENLANAKSMQLTISAE